MMFVLKVYRSKRKKEIHKKNIKLNLLLSWQVFFSLNTYPPFLFHVVDDVHELLDHKTQLIHEDLEYALENQIFIEEIIKEY
jgi:hypothetical protein